jgi:hypothetical protein
MVGRRLHCKYTHATARGASLRGDSGIAAARAIALAGLVFVTVSPTFGGAATLAEVAHCRNQEKLAERISCFKGLKHGANAKGENAAAPEAKDITSENADGPAAAGNPRADAANQNDTRSGVKEPGSAGKRVSSAKARGAVPGADPLSSEKSGWAVKGRPATKAAQETAPPAAPAETGAPTEPASPSEAKSVVPSKLIAAGSNGTGSTHPAQKDSAALDPAMSPDPMTTGTAASAKDEAARATNADLASDNTKDRPPDVRTTPSGPPMTGQAVTPRNGQAASPQAATASTAQADHGGPPGRAVPTLGGPGELVPTGKALFPPVALFPPTGQAVSPMLPPAGQVLGPRAEQAGPAKPEQGTPTKARDAATPTKSEDPVTSTSLIGNASPAGQPLCKDPDSLAAMLVAGLLTSNQSKAATDGCQTLPEDAKLTRLERYPSVFPAMHIVRVKVSSPSRLDLTFGFTVETGR